VIHPVDDAEEPNPRTVSGQGTEPSPLAKTPARRHGGFEPSLVEGARTMTNNTQRVFMVIPDSGPESQAGVSSTSADRSRQTRA
jgi:hypothetical protein